jgi:hypothetical protein
MMMQLFTLHDGWYWADETESRGPFQTEDEAANDYVDSHIAPED